MLGEKNWTHVIFILWATCSAIVGQKTLVQKPACGQDEVYSSCGSVCGEKCPDKAAKGFRICPTVCDVGCFCRSGLLRNAQDRCVPQEFCNEKTDILREHFGDKVAELQKFQAGWTQKQKFRFRPSKAQVTWINGIVQKMNIGFKESAGAKQPASQGQKSFFWGPRVRKEYRQLTRTERHRFHAAVHAMMTTTIPGSTTTQYHSLVEMHQSVQSPAAHGGPAFTPWHRIYLLLFEMILRTHDATVTLPYWDSTLDWNLTNARESILFSDKFLGSSSQQVTSGNFAFWPVISSCSHIGTGMSLNRGLSTFQSWLYQDSIINFFNSFTSYSDLIRFSFFEPFHGGPHLYIGGHMADIQCSPSDPIFFMHHAFVDRLWEDFRQNSQTTNMETDYPWPGPWHPAHAPNAPMLPFAGLKNIQGLLKLWTSFFYKYNDRPTTCTSDTSCGAYLWCDKSVVGGRCTSKVKTLGDCSGFPVGSTSPCECGECLSSGKCEIVNLVQWIACWSV